VPVNETAPLAPHRYLSLATFRRNGAAVTTPVWFAVSEGRLYVFTASASGKVKRLRHSSRVQIAPCDVRGRLRGGWQGATARIVGDASSIQRAHAALRAKYGWQMCLADVLARVGKRIQRRAWIEIDVIPATGSGGTPASRH
jgi:uncharacterized protein